MSYFDIIKWESENNNFRNNQIITVLHSTTSWEHAEELFQNVSKELITQTKDSRYTLTEHTLIIFGKTKYVGINILKKTDIT